MNIMNIKKFDLCEISNRSKILIIGKPGISYISIIKDILHTLNPKVGIIINESNNEYNEFKDLYISDTYSTTLIKELFNRQHHKNINKNKDACLVIDSNNKKLLEDRYIKTLCINGGNLKLPLVFIIASQNCIDFPPILRCSIDYVFIMKETNPTILKKIFDNYCGIFPTFEMFLKVFNACTSDYQCMVVTNRYNRIEDNIFWYTS